MAEAAHPQRRVGMMTHPSQSRLNWLLFKTPLVMWRMGLGPLLVRRHVMVLTTIGRNSGLPRHTGLEYSIVDGVVTTAAGWGERSDWYRNIRHNPLVTLQTAEGTFSAIARRVMDADHVRAMMEPVLESGGDAYFRPWLESLDIRPEIEDIVAKRDRLLLVAFDLIDQLGPIPLKADLVWLWPVLGLVFAAGWLVGRLQSSE